MIEVSLTKYLRELAKGWGGADNVYVTKTYGGQVWLSDEAPGELFKSEGVNYIEFNDSCMFMRLPKEVYQHFELKAGHSKLLKDVLKEITEKEKSKSVEKFLEEFMEDGNEKEKS